MVDLDQSGRFPQVQRTYLGPSLGWVQTDQPTDLQFGCSSGATILPGLKGFIFCREWATIQSWVVLANATGSIILDIWKVPLASFITGTLPTVANSITGVEFPQLSGQFANSLSTLRGWNNIIQQNDVLAIVCNSCSGISKVNLTLRCIRNLGPPT